MMRGILDGSPMVPSSQVVQSGSGNATLGLLTALANTAKTLTVPGVQVGDTVLSVTAPGLPGNVAVKSAVVTAPDTVSVTLMTTAAIALSLGADLYTVTYTRP